MLAEKNGFVETRAFEITVDSEIEDIILNNIKTKLKYYQNDLKHSKMHIETYFEINERTVLRATFTELIPETLKYDEDAIKDIIADIHQSVKEVNINEL